MEGRQDDNASRSRFPDGFRILQGKQEYVTYIDHSSVRVWYSEVPWRYETHFHSAVEIIVPVRGEVCYELAEGSYRVQADEVLIVPPDTIHALSMAEGSARYLFLFEPGAIFGMRDMNLLEDVLRAPIYITGQSEIAAPVRELLLDAVTCYEERGPLWNSACYAYLLRMYVMIGQEHYRRGFRPHAGDHGMDNEIVDSACLYIDQNFMRDLSLEKVSAFTGFSQCYFSRMFKKRMGVSFSAYLRGKRVAMAEELLIHSALPVQEIAANAGFGSIATFNRVFRDEKGCTPTRFREIYGDL